MPTNPTAKEGAGAAAAAAIELTPRRLEMPYAAAARHARPGTRRFHELASAAGVALLAAARSYREGAGSSPDAWLYLAASRAALREATHRGWWARRVACGSAAAAVALSSAPCRSGCGGGADLLEARDFVARALAALPAAQREAYVLRHGCGMSIREVAAAVRRSVDTVKNRLAGAQRRFDAGLVREVELCRY